MIFHSYVSLPEGNGISMEHWQKIVVFLALWQWNMAGKYTRFRSMIFPWFSQHVSIGFCQLSPWSPVPPIWKSSARISRIVSLVSSKNHHHWSNSWLSDKLSIYLSIYIYIDIMTHQHLSQVQHLYLQGSWWFNVIQHPQDSAPFSL